MTVACAAPLCPTYKEDNCFRFFSFPSKGKLCQLWLEHVPQEEVFLNQELYFCEIHFDDDQFVLDDRRNDLKVDAVPTVFQHITPVDYASNVCKTLKHFGRNDDFVLKAWQVVQRIENEDTSSPSFDEGMLSQLCSLLVLSELQRKRILRKEKALAEYENNNNLLKEIYREKLNCVKIILEHFRK